jgi:hypothetical protein
MRRPLPPEALREPGEIFAPAHDVAAWLRSTFLEPRGALSNADHAHLLEAEIGVLWTNAENVTKMVGVVGMAEIFFPRGNAWQKARQRHQVVEWFGAVPDFLMTLSAPYASVCDDLTWCALVEHELYHMAQAVDEYGAPRFRKDGTPVFSIREHDVTEFVGVTRRYGQGVSRNVAEMVAAALAPPEVADVDAAWACGTCQIRAV